MAESLSTESLVWTSAPDPRTAGWFLVGKENFWRLLGLMAVYVVGVKVVGPWMMRNRKPYEIRNVVLMYNLFMILASAFFLGEFVRMAYFENKYTLFLQELDMSDRPATLRLVSLSWWYYMLRIFEFTEAVFFVLRKKYGQVGSVHNPTVSEMRHIVSTLLLRLECACSRNLYLFACYVWCCLCVRP